MPLRTKVVSEFADRLQLRHFEVAQINESETGPEQSLRCFEQIAETAPDVARVFVIEFGNCHLRRKTTLFVLHCIIPSTEEMHLVGSTRTTATRTTAAGSCRSRTQTRPMCR